MVNEKASHGSPFLSLEMSHGGTGHWDELKKYKVEAKV